MIPTTRPRKESTLFKATFLAVMEINCSHKTLSNTALLTAEPGIPNAPPYLSKPGSNQVKRKKGDFRNILKVR